MHINKTWGEISRSPVKFLENLSKSGKFTTTVTDKEYFSFDNPIEYNQIKKKIIK